MYSLLLTSTQWNGSRVVSVESGVMNVFLLIFFLISHDFRWKYKKQYKLLVLIHWIIQKSKTNNIYGSMKLQNILHLILFRDSACCKSSWLLIAWLKGYRTKKW